MKIFCILTTLAVITSGCVFSEIQTLEGFGYSQIEKLEMKPCTNPARLTPYSRFRASKDFTFKAVRNGKPVTGRWCLSLGYVESKTLESPDK
jgi:hypothetical protein